MPLGYTGPQGEMRSLADGQLPVATAALYTVPAGLRALIKTITLVNTAAAQRTVNLYINTGAGNRCIIPQNLPLEADYQHIVPNELTLEAGDAIQGDASVAACVDYTINGIEEA